MLTPKSWIESKFRCSDYIVIHFLHYFRGAYIWLSMLFQCLKFRNKNTFLSFELSFSSDQVRLFLTCMVTFLADFFSPLLSTTISICFLWFFGGLGMSRPFQLPLFSSTGWVIISISLLDWLNTDNSCLKIKILSLLLVTVDAVRLFVSSFEQLRVKILNTLLSQEAGFLLVCWRSLTDNARLHIWNTEVFTLS